MNVNLNCKCYGDLKTPAENKLKLKFKKCSRLKRGTCAGEQARASRVPKKSASAAVEHSTRINFTRLRL